MNKEKTLSQQLCELCGVKKGRVLDTSFSWCNACRYKEGLDGCQRPGGVECPPHYKMVYPNFENPENFVKLLELKIEPSQSTLWRLVNNNCKDFGQLPPYSIERFLISLMLLLVNNPKWVSDEQIELIKQAIRNYDGWVWG